MPSVFPFQIIQGGMGAGVSAWQLARAVSRQGELGVLSGTGLGVMLVRRLQSGDVGGHMRRAFQAFPYPLVTQRVLERYFIEGGKPAATPFTLTPMPILNFAAPLVELTVVANFVEVYLAKEGHHGLVGMNYLEKIQTPTLASLLGAMLAGVDVILMGAGIPRLIPGAIAALADGKPAELRIDVFGAAPGEVHLSRLDPAQIWGDHPATLKRPAFLAIVSSATLAMTLARKSNGKVDGFVVEGATAGGHNAPPRGPLHLNDKGEPVYGERDTPDLEKIANIGLPFFLAGSYGRRGGLAAALALGASGIQVGTAFALCQESDIAPELKRQVLALSQQAQAAVFTDPRASPTGFPFKVIQLPETLSDVATYEARPRVCDLGYLRQVYKKEDGTLGYRCPAEPAADYAKKGGDVAETVGRKCLCNGLFGTIGLPQIGSTGQLEPAILTAGDDVVDIAQLIAPGQETYSAADVLAFLRSPAVTNGHPVPAIDTNPCPAPMH